MQNMCRAVQRTQKLSLNLPGVRSATIPRRTQSKRPPSTIAANLLTNTTLGADLATATNRRLEHYQERSLTRSRSGSRCGLGERFG